MTYIDYCNKTEDVNREYQTVKIEGYTGHWSAIQKIILDDTAYYLFEHDYYGDETCYLVCVVRYRVGNKIAVSELYETYDGLIQCLIDEEIIEVEF